MLNFFQQDQIGNNVCAIRIPHNYWVFNREEYGKLVLKLNSLSAKGEVTTVGFIRKFAKKGTTTYATEQFYLVDIPDLRVNGIPFNQAMPFYQGVEIVSDCPLVFPPVYDFTISVTGDLYIYRGSSERIKL